MHGDFEIGRVVAVDTAQVTIELNRDLKGMTRNTYEGPHEVGRINSYVIIPVGARRLVAMVTRVVLVEEAEIKPDRTMVSLPSARRMMKATLIGTIDGGRFTQGVSIFPVLDSPVYLAGSADLDAIFGPLELGCDEVEDPANPGYCIPIGESTIVRGRPIRINPDAFFGKHVAVLGSTGSGKSCTIASILQSVRRFPGVKRTTCIILDTNGEYRTAFQRQREDGCWESVGPGNVVYVPSGPNTSPDRLVIPYWFMNTEDFVRLFQASRGVQRPVLLEALRLARNSDANRSPFVIFREELIYELNRIWSLSGRDDRISKDVRDLAAGLRRRILDEELEEAWQEAQRIIGVTRNDVAEALMVVQNIAEKHVGPNPQGVPTFSQPLPADAKRDIRRAIEEIYTKLTTALSGETSSLSQRSADAPAYFDKVKFRERYIEQVLRREESGGARAREMAGTMLLRIDRLLADRRFDFLFGPVGEPLPRPAHALAAFLRDMLGLGAAPSTELSNEEEVPRGLLPFYDRQRDGEGPMDIVILDLSSLAAEVLENVTALIGRLILEFLQRLGEYGGEDARGSLPVILVLEEAQNYIRETRHPDDESIARDVFERIAREGRKFGLSLVVASQRPSELSRTVLSQCSSFIVHRLQNPEDLRYFREVVPAIYGPMLEQVPALAPQTALVLGECVPAPVLVRIQDANPAPRSRNPRFFEYWVAKEQRQLPVEAVCAEWEGNSQVQTPVLAG